MVITNVEVQKKNKNRINVYADGEFIMGIDVDTYVQYGLRKGIELSPEKIIEIENYEGNIKAYQKTIDLIAYRDRSEKEIKDRLKRDEYSEESIRFAIDRAKKHNLLNDKEHAMYFSEIRYKKESWGKLRSRLYLKGIDEDLIEEIKKKLYDFGEELNKANRDLKKMERSIMRLEKDKRMSSIWSRMLYRQYDSDVIKEAIDNCKYLT